MTADPQSLHPLRCGWCVYCGLEVRGRRYPLTCPAHRDLLRVDPYYAQVDQWKRARKR